MTKFSKAPNSGNYVMETVFPEASLAVITTLEAVSDRGLTKTDFINQVIGTHR